MYAWTKYIKMGPKKPTSKRINTTTVTYKPTFEVQFTTKQKHTSTRVRHCTLFPGNASKKPRPSADHPYLFQHHIPEGTAPIRKPPRLYRDRKVREVESWLKIRPTLLRAAIEVTVPNSTNCSLCDSEDATYRCHDCLPLPLCYTCVVNSHALQPLHVIEQLLPEHPDVYWPIRIAELLKIRAPVFIPVGSERTKEINLIDSKGRTHHKCVIVYPGVPGGGDEVFISSLIKLGFWPLSPTAPKTAISLELLSLMQCLTLECHTSAQGFVSAIEKAAYNPRKVISKLGKTLRGESLAEFRLFWQALDQGLISFLPDFKPWVNSCPACPKASGSGPLILSFDGNFGLVHKSNSGITHSSHSPVSDLYFIKQERVDAFVNSYYQDTKDRTQVCSQFQAADAVRSKNKAANLNVTGVFGASCKHEVPHLFMDLRHGERLSYPVMLFKEIKARLPENVQLKLLYDIACTLKSHLRKRKNESLLEDVQLAIPVFHSYGHRGECQITMNPRRLAGFGLTDGEQLERLWSYLRLFSKITKEQTPGHRKELLAMALLNYAQKKADSIAIQLEARLRKAEQTKETAKQFVSKELNVLCGRLPLTDREALVAQLEVEENEYLQYLKRDTKNPIGTWKQSYAKELLLYHTLHNQLHSGLVSAEDADKVFQTARAIQLSSKKLLSYEKQHKIQRWTDATADYQEQLAIIEDGRRSDLIDKLHALLIEKQWHSHTIKTHSGGQGVINRVSGQLKTATKNICVTIKAYNAGSTEDLPSKLPSSLTTAEVNLEHEMFSAVHQQPTVTGVPVRIRRKVLDQISLQERCCEEKEMIKKEMKNAYMHFYSLHQKLSQLLTKIESSSMYNRGIWTMGFLGLIKLRARLSLMWDTMNRHSDIPAPPVGYTPPKPSGTENVVEDREEQDDEWEDVDDEPSSDDEDEEEIEDFSVFETVIA